MDAQVTDGEIIAASRRRPELFEVIFDRHYGAVVRFASGRVGPDEGPDVAADTFVRAFDRRHRFRPDQDSALPWLFGIAANVVRERRRSLSRLLGAAERAASRWTAGEESRFELESADRLDAEARRSDLLAALARLTDDEYEVLMLSALGQMTYPDIAHRLDIPIGTVRSRLHRARRKMQELLTVERPIAGGRSIHGRAP